ncbi:MAG TPA: M15 family metallopeptidase [Candidatus Binatia bacterium]
MIGPGGQATDQPSRKPSRSRGSTRAALSVRPWSRKRGRRGDGENVRRRPRRSGALLALALVCVALLPACSGGRQRGWTLRADRGSAPSAATRKPGPPPEGFVDLATVEPSIQIDIRYATTNNFTGVAVYPVARCLLRPDVAERLARVHRELQTRGLGLKVWDCYRPISVQQRLWELVPDPRYVVKPVFRDGRPVEGSKHNRGAAVDVTMVDANGVEVPMPTDYDDFSERAHRTNMRGDPQAVRNMRILEVAMVREGFEPLPTEWWHFDAPNWEKYPLSDAPLAK